MSEPDRFHVTSIFGHATQRGLVDIRLVGGEAQVTPAKAREMAAFMLEAATAAEGDEVLMTVLARVGMSPQRAAQVLMAMRRERAIIERRARAEARRAIAEDRYDDDAPDLP